MTTASKTHDDPLAGPALPGLLVDPDWLAAHLGNPWVHIVDLRDREEYENGHVPGAVQLDLEDLGEIRDECENVILQPLDFERLMARLGISNGDTVVAYDDHWGLPAARLIWALHFYGERTVAVLNGGWDLWQEEGRPTAVPSSGAGAQVQTADFEAHIDADVAADYEWITNAAGRGDLVLVDTRSQTEYEQGHLPGAVSWDWINAVPTGSWESARDSRALRSELAELGVRPSDEVVAYCRSGMRAAHTYLVLRHAGFPRVRLYDGSWQEWTRRNTSEMHGDT